VSKALALGSWVEKCDSKTLLKDEIDLSELFHPDTFLNALRQQTARYYSTTIVPFTVVAAILKINQVSA
jgi:dynein heavy chain 2